MNPIGKYSLLAAWEEKLPILGSQMKLVRHGVDSGIYVLLLPVGSES